MIGNDLSIGFDPFYDYLLDPQQQPRTELDEGAERMAFYMRGMREDGDV